MDNKDILYYNILDKIDESVIEDKKKSNDCNGKIMCAVRRINIERMTAYLFNYSLMDIKEMKFNLMWDLHMTIDEINNMPFWKFQIYNNDLCVRKSVIRKQIE